MKTVARFLSMGLSLALAVPALARASDPPMPATRVPVLLPDGRPYADNDLSARILPEAGQRAQPPVAFVPKLSPVPRLTYEGWRAAATNRPDAAQINFARALRITPNDRHLLWAYGWAQLNMDDPAAAMAAFQRNLALRPAQRPQWLPMAMALVYTSAGERDAAVAWYRAAALSDPMRWGSDKRVLLTTLEWTPKERQLVNQLLTYSAEGQSGEPMPFAQVAMRAGD